MLAVIAVTAVGFITDRAERALSIEANRLMGGDAVVRGDKPQEVTYEFYGRNWCRCDER